MTLSREATINTLLDEAFAESDDATLDRVRLRLSFWKFVEKQGDCWVWTGSYQSAGTPTFYLGHSRWAQAARWAYTTFVGPVPTGTNVHHTCRNSRCVRPSHIAPYSIICRNGHTVDETTAYYPPNGRRQCRLCTKERLRRKKAEYQSMTANASRVPISTD